MDKWLNKLQILIIIIGLPLTIIGLLLNAEALTNTRKVESANFLENFNHYIDQDKNSNDLMTAIEGEGMTPHSSKFPLLQKSGGKFTAGDIESYIGNYDDIGVLYKDGLIDRRMAYDDFSYSVEKIWCNKDVQSVINNLRSRDGDSTTQNAYYQPLENLANTFFQMENKNKDCDSIENQ